MTVKDKVKAVPTTYKVGLSYTLQDVLDHHMFEDDVGGRHGMKLVENACSIPGLDDTFTVKVGGKVVKPSSITITQDFHEDDWQEVIPSDFSF